MQFNGWFILVLIVALICYMIAYSMTRDMTNSSRVLPRLGIATVIWTVGYVVLVAVFALGSLIAWGERTPPVWHHQPEPVPLSYMYVAEELGFESGREYPLTLGSRISGASGESSVSTTVVNGFLFSGISTTVESSLGPSSAISLSYSYEGKSYIVEIPTSHVTFKQTTVDEPSATLWLNDGTSTYLGFQDWTPYTESSCRWTYMNLLPMCLWPPYEGTLRPPQINQDVLELGLSPIIANSFVRAEVVLTPEMYNQLLGVIEVEE